MVLLLCMPVGLARAGCGWKAGKLTALNQRLSGQVLDFTHNHGADHRIYSPALQHYRDLYVYLPPAFDPSQRYPFMIWLHGFAQDEQAFLDEVVGYLDAAILAGQLPPFIVAAPDGSVSGRPNLFGRGTFFLNSHLGNFEDYVVQDVWDFVVGNFPIRPEREAHVIAGVSMGGGAAFNLAIKHRQCFKVVVGVFPPLNLRWRDCHGRYRANFNPQCWGWWTDPALDREVVARFLGGLYKVRINDLLYPLYGKGLEALLATSRENPIEMIDRYGLRPGQLDLFVAYGGEDEFNLDAQVESFLHFAQCRGLFVGVAYDPKGRHDQATAVRLFPHIISWLGPLLAPYSPPLASSW
jgi:pimeloyl-ACP methyl ester carboxylesterase